MKKIISSTILCLVLVLALAACNLPRPQTTPTTDSNNQVSTAAAMTVAALSTQIALQASPTVAVVQNTPVPPPTTAPLPPTAVPSPSPTSLPCDVAEFITDVTIEDNTLIAPGASFTKTWRLANKGSCTWTTGYKIIFDHGNTLNAPASVNLPQNVAPGQTIDISVNMKAPDTAKDYESYWKMQNASGTPFGLGTKGDKFFWVKIKVGSPTPTAAPFAITKVNMSADNANYSGACPHTFNLSAEITSTAAGNVTYFWEFSDGSKTSKQSVDFGGPGNKTVTTTWQVASNFDGWVKVYIDNPNHQYFSQFNLKAACTP